MAKTNKKTSKSRQSSKQQPAGKKAKVVVSSFSPPRFRFKLIHALIFAGLIAVIGVVFILVSNAASKRNWNNFYATRIIACESGGKYRNRGAGGGGAYQIIPSTWHSLGGHGKARNASKAEQDKR